MKFELPLTDPVLIFAFILMIILIMPLIFERIRIPGLIGVILAGIIFGPHGLGVLNRDNSIELFGTVGLLYLMFIAGLEIDLDEFIKNKNKSIVFGLITFSIPMVLGIIAGKYFLNMDILPTILLASTFASHTLLAYSIISKLGLTNNQAVTIAVGGTIITDVLALLILVVIVRFENGAVDIMFWVRIMGSFIILTVIVFWGLPKLLRIFFRSVEGDGEQQYIFVLAALFICAFLAKLGEIEPIIGAFFAGLAMNRYIPESSALMNRIRFIGNTIFIPFFLISVGMLVNINVFFEGINSWKFAVVMTFTAMSAKYIAAYLTQRIYSYSREEGFIIFGLSNAQAAATLAAVIIAFRIGLFDINVLNGSIFMILITCLISTSVVERNGRKLAVSIKQAKVSDSELPEKILVPLSDEKDIEQIIEFAGLLKSENSGEDIFALNVIRETKQPHHQVLQNYKALSKGVHQAAATENVLRIITRIDVSIAAGILRAIKELAITDIVFTWRGRYRFRESIIGNVLDKVVNDTSQSIYICRFLFPPNTINRFIVLVPEYAQHESGFLKWLFKVRKLAKETGAACIFKGSAETLNSIKSELDKAKPALNAQYELLENFRNMNANADGYEIKDLVLLVNARQHTISWNRYLHSFPKKFIRANPKVNFMILYPEQLANHI